MDFKQKVFDVNGHIYISLYSVKYDNKDYVYIVNEKDQTDTHFFEVEEDTLLNIDPILFNNIIFPMFTDVMQNKE